MGLDTIQIKLFSFLAYIFPIPTLFLYFWISARIRYSVDMIGEIRMIGWFRFLWSTNLSFVIVLILNFTAFQLLILISVFLELIMCLYLIQLGYKHYLPTNLLATNNHPKCLHFSIFILFWHNLPLFFLEMILSLVSVTSFSWFFF